MVEPANAVGPALRRECKQLLRKVVEHIRNETTNVSDESITDFLYERLASHFFSEKQQEALQVFGPIMG
jgi:hypothetical protein